MTHLLYGLVGLGFGLVLPGVSEAFGYPFGPTTPSLLAIAITIAVAGFAAGARCRQGSIKRVTFWTY